MPLAEIIQKIGCMHHVRVILKPELKSACVYWIWPKRYYIIHLKNGSFAYVTSPSTIVRDKLKLIHHSGDCYGLNFWICFLISAFLDFSSVSFVFLNAFFIKFCLHYRFLVEAQVMLQINCSLQVEHLSSLWYL